MDPEADPEQIKQAFYRLARQYHPDLAGSDTTLKFQQISEAYEVLRDPLRRRQYDATLNAAPATDQDPLVVVRIQPAPPDLAQSQHWSAQAIHLRKLIKERKLVQAVTQAKRWVEQNPGHPKAIHLLALAYHRLGSELRLRGDAQARHYLTLALETEPEKRQSQRIEN